MDTLKKLRKERGLNQSTLAKELNISVSAYGNYELDQREPSIENLKKLADFYNVSIDYLVGRKTQRPFGEWTDEDYANGVTDKARIEVTVAEYEWLELRSEVLRVKGEDYLKTLIDMIEGITKNSSKKS